MTQTFDAIFIGAGQAAPALASRFSQEGYKIAVVERKLFGGTCVNVGCVPTKTLVASARAVHVARHAGDYGVVLPGKPENVTVDMKKVKARKDEIVARSNKGVENWMKNLKNTTVFEGHATFVGPRTIEVNGEQVEAEKIFLNVGARAVVPPVPGLAEVNPMTNTQMMDLDTLPEHLLIMGGSYIGLEFGQMYRRFGSRVTIVERGERLIPRDDTDVSAEVKRILEAEGVEFALNAGVVGAKKEGTETVIQLETPEGPKEISGSHLLVAVGRKPNTEDLGLEAAGIETDERGFIKVNETLHTTNPNVWAMGDCNGQGAFTHTSWNDYEIVAANVLDNSPRQTSDRILAYGLFIDPPLGRCGMTEAQVRASGIKALKAKMPMSRVGRARERGETDGFMKILVEAETGLILGAALLGIEGDEVVHILLSAMYAGTPCTTLMRQMHIHPTVSELIPTLLSELKPL